MGLSVQQNAKVAFKVSPSSGGNQDVTIQGVAGGRDLFPSAERQTRLQQTAYYKWPSESPIANCLPATLIPDAAVTDELLDAVSNQTTELFKCERLNDGQLRLYPPQGRVNSQMIHRIYMDLVIWCFRTRRRGYPTVGTGYFLQDGSMMIPDIAYISPKRRKGLVLPNPKHNLRVCPNFVVEVCSSPSEFLLLKEKMTRWMANGVELGWLVNAHQQKVFVYMPGSQPKAVDGTVIVGDVPVDRFFVVLLELW